MSTMLLALARYACLFFLPLVAFWNKVKASLVFDTQWCCRRHRYVALRSNDGDGAGHDGGAPPPQAAVLGPGYLKYRKGDEMVVLGKVSAQYRQCQIVKRARPEAVADLARGHAGASTPRGGQHGQAGEAYLVERTVGQSGIVDIGDLERIGHPTHSNSHGNMVSSASEALPSRGVADTGGDGVGWGDQDDRLRGGFGNDGKEESREEGARPVSRGSIDAATKKKVAESRGKVRTWG